MKNLGENALSEEQLEKVAGGSDPCMKCHYLDGGSYDSCMEYCHKL